MYLSSGANNFYYNFLETVHHCINLLFGLYYFARILSKTVSKSVQKMHHITFKPMYVVTEPTRIATELLVSVEIPCTAYGMFIAVESLLWPAFDTLILKTGNSSEKVPKPLCLFGLIFPVKLDSC